MMNAAKCRIHGSDYIGVFCAASESIAFIADSTREKEKELIASKLGVRIVGTRLAGSELVGIFSRANSNGIIISELAYGEEVAALKGMGLGINILVLDSNLNAVGCNILTNDKVALVNEEYTHGEAKLIGDTLGVEIVRAKTGGFATIGANNIITNTGLVVNNRATEAEKEHIERVTGLNSSRSTANTGGLAVGLSVVANSKGVVAGEATTGFELARIIEALEG
jgi:translation initiation factor 6